MTGSLEYRYDSGAGPVCQRCGVPVHDEAKHTDWHANVSAALGLLLNDLRKRSPNLDPAEEYAEMLDYVTTHD